MLQASCHCGNISITINSKPASLISCNCSICLRLGALWGYFFPEDITINTKNNPPKAYQWGDKNIDFQHCPNCGCTTHYIPTKASGREKMAVNFRMVDKDTFEAIFEEKSGEINVRHFDGADTWQFIEPAVPQQNLE